MKITFLQQIDVAQLCHNCANIDIFVSFWSNELFQVIAYIMKEYSMNISVAQEYVKKIRSCVNPNPGFQKQLEEYNGILEARSAGYKQRNT